MAFVAVLVRARKERDHVSLRPPPSHDGGYDDLYFLKSRSKNHIAQVKLGEPVGVE